MYKNHADNQQRSLRLKLHEINSEYDEDLSVEDIRENLALALTKIEMQFTEINAADKTYGKTKETKKLRKELKERKKDLIPKIKQLNSLIKSFNKSRCNESTNEIFIELIKGHIGKTLYLMLWKEANNIYDKRQQEFNEKPHKDIAINPVNI